MRHWSEARRRASPGQLAARFSKSIGYTTLAFSAPEIVQHYSPRLSWTSALAGGLRSMRIATARLSV